MVEAVLANNTHEALRVGIRTRRTDRHADGLNTDRGEHLIEAPDELGVSVTDEEAESPSSLFEVGNEVAGNLGHPWPARVGGDAEDVHDAAVHLDDEQYVNEKYRHGSALTEIFVYGAVQLLGRACNDTTWDEGLLVEVIAHADAVVPVGNPQWDSLNQQNG